MGRFGLVGPARLGGRDCGHDCRDWAARLVGGAVDGAAGGRGVAESAGCPAVEGIVGCEGEGVGGTARRPFRGECGAGRRGVAGAAAALVVPAMGRMGLRFEGVWWTCRHRWSWRAAAWVAWEVQGRGGALGQTMPQLLQVC